MEKRIKEEFLHYIWKLKRFEFRNLATTINEPVSILDFGRANANAGPDFTNGKVRIGNTTWVGNIEIHVNASDWLKHGHQHDSAYNNVILHVVYKADRPIYRKSGEEIPCIELKRLISPSLHGKYRQLQASAAWIPCESRLSEVPNIIRVGWLDRILIERMEDKTRQMATAFFENKEDWEETFYQLLARNFGMKVNAIPFELLAKALPLKILRKHINRPFQIEALIFGQAGLLGEVFIDKYPNDLRKEFAHLANKYGLTPFKKEIWKFSKLRPANFPSIRLAQFAALLGRSQHLFRDILESKTVNKMDELLRAETPDYWNTRYQFDKPTEMRPRSIGRNSRTLFIINSVTPLLFLYGQRKADPKYAERALDILRTLPPEKNATIDRWKQTGMEVVSAADSQALLELKKHYCDRKKCVNCAIGSCILKPSRKLSVVEEDAAIYSLMTVKFKKNG